MEAHEKWIHAFNWWYHSAKKDRIIDNLRDGVPLSHHNSKFLAAVLDGSVKPLSGKESGLARFKNQIITSKIIDLKARGLSRDEILDDLKRTELMPSHTAKGAIDKRIDREQNNPVEKHAELDAKFRKLYSDVGSE